MKEKAKATAYKLQLDIEEIMDLKKILEEYILNDKEEFILEEVLGITKKEFYEVIMNIIKKKL